MLMVELNHIEERVNQGTKPFGHVKQLYLFQDKQTSKDLKLLKRRELKRKYDSKN